MGGAELDSPQVDRLRSQMGGQLQLRAHTQTEWFLSDLDTARLQAESGDLSRIAQLSKIMRRDGVIAGLAETRTSGLLALPRKISGRAEMVTELESTPTTTSVFDSLAPSAALAAFLYDIIVVGAAVGEMVPLIGGKGKQFVRLDPQFLRYRWSEDRWYYASTAGLLPITPGDGRWVFATSNRLSPWDFALWEPLGRAYIIKEHALLGRASFSSKLANPAIVGYSPPAATEVQQDNWLQRLKAWGYNTVFQTPLGWDVKILETNGRGWEVFGVSKEDAEKEIVIALTGSTVMVDGGTGFANAGIHQQVKADLIEKNGKLLSEVVTTQILAPWTVENYGIDALSECARVEWDTRPPGIRKEEGESLSAFGAGISAANQALAPYGKSIDMQRLSVALNVPLQDGAMKAPESEPESPPKAEEPTLIA
jgi:hypothetical protein